MHRRGSRHARIVAGPGPRPRILAAPHVQGARLSLCVPLVALHTHTQTHTHTRTHTHGTHTYTQEQRNNSRSTHTPGTKKKSERAPAIAQVLTSVCVCVSVCLRGRRHGRTRQSVRVVCFQRLGPSAGGPTEVPIYYKGVLRLESSSAFVSFVGVYITTHRHRNRHIHKAHTHTHTHTQTQTDTDIHARQTQTETQPKTMPYTDTDTEKYTHVQAYTGHTAVAGDIRAGRR